MEQGACGDGSARSISGRCKISRNLRKRLECGAAIGPPGRGLGRAGEGRREEVDGKYEGVVQQRGVVIWFPPLPAQPFPSASKADHQFCFPWGPQPCTRTVPGRDLPREFHIANGQIRRNAGGGAPGRTPWMGLRLCSPTIIRFGRQARRAISPLPQGALCRADPASPRPTPRREVLEQSSAAEDHLGSLWCYREAAVPKVGRSLTYDWSWKFSYHQFILKNGNVGNHQRLRGFVGLSNNLVLIGTILRSRLPTFHLCPSPAASSPRLVPPQSHLQSLQLFRDGPHREVGQHQ